MNMTLMVLLIESGIVLLVLIGIIVFMGWKKKKSQAAMFEKLLKNIKEIEGERKIQLAQFLVDSHALSEQDAKESGEYMVESEKQFLEQFIKQQMEQKPITDFYSDLCGLLDQYLSFVPVSKVVVAKAVSEVAENLSNDVGAESFESKGGKEDLADEIEQTEEEPGWGDAFSESGDLTDEPESTEQSTPEEPKKETSEDIEQTEEEPDWGDAFAESGDSMDELESTEQSTPEQSKKETAKDIVQTEEEPDWGDAFAESGDTMDSSENSDK